MHSRCDCIHHYSAVWNLWKVKENKMIIQYDFKPLGKPTKYPVRDSQTFEVLIPAGATGVEIAYGQSSKTYKNKRTGKIERQNVYRWNGKIYNA